MSTGSDMPNPLSTITKRGTIRHGYDGLKQEPELVTWMLTVITTWPYLEGQLGYSLARFLKTEAKMGVAIYGALMSTTVQTDVLKRVASEALASDDDLLIFLALLGMVRSISKRRTPLVHDTWGTDPRVPKALLCLKAETRLRRRGAVIPQWDEWLRSDTEANDPPDMPNPEADEVMMYTEKNFSDLYRDLSDLIRHFSEFWKMRDGLPPGRAVLRSKLENAPQLGEAIRRLRAEGQKTQKSPPPNDPPAPLQE
jgi:hypothetical protein